jgi:phosphate/phosphite/phosphonate ABC transporter binding protein
MSGARRARWALLGVAVFAVALSVGVLLRRVTGPGGSLSRATGHALRLGLPPSFPAAVARQELAGLARYLQRELSRPVELVVPPSYKDLRKGLLRGELDLANLPPLQFVLARREHRRLRGLVTSTYDGASRYQSFLVTRQESSIVSLADLRGRRVCYVDPGSTSGYLLPRHFLRQRGLDPDRLFSSVRFSGNHLAVMQDLLHGRCDVGAIYSIAFLESSRHGVATTRLRMVAVAGQLPYDVFCASPALDGPTARRLARALLTFDPRRELGRSNLGPTFRINGFVRPTIADYEVVERAASQEGVLAAPETVARLSQEK